LDARVRVCATCEDLAPDADQRPRTFITNTCLKPTLAQWRALRTQDCQFEVLAERLTGDRSVGFQLARRTRRPAQAVGDLAKTGGNGSS